MTNSSAFRSRSGSITGSIKLQALSIQQDSVRSIGGRLGGHFDSTRSIQLPGGYASSSSVGIELPTEASQLLGSSVGGGGREAGTSPPMAAWIFPALTCALAYAFYNVSTRTFSPVYIATRYYYMYVY